METLCSEMGAGQYPVTEVSHSSILMKDGTSLAIKVWLPCAKEKISTLFPYFSTGKQLMWSKELSAGSISPTAADRFPAIMEYIPYAKDTEMTLERDHMRHPWFCSHGFVDVRVDIRGTGASEGINVDEYDEQELEDGVEIIEWIASQHWSNERVGMYGKSWGGFNGLQIAYKQPKALKTVISLYSTDNRYTDDIHYEGNAIIANGLLSWAGYMMAYNARPTHPRYFDSVKAWKDFWLERLQNYSQSLLCTWLHHQHPSDPYWQHGSICHNVSKPDCPILVIGGHEDSYINAAFRMAGTLNESSRAIIGPWSHQWPDVSIPGPNIDFLSICLKWWSAHLKNDEAHIAEVSAWPRLNLFIRDSIKPVDIVNPSPGKWVKITDWDERLKNVMNYPNKEDSNANSLRKLFLGGDMKILFEPADPIIPVELLPHPLQGSSSGTWLTIDCGFSGDQSASNKHSHCWTSEILEEDVVFAGLAKMYVCVESKLSGQYYLHVRVCDEFPSGESFLVTRGFQNLSNLDSGWVSHFPSKVKKTVCINLKGVGHTVRHGHRLLISITPTYFPMVYPASNSKGLVIHPSESHMVLQTLSMNEEDGSSLYSCPKPLLKLPVNQLTPASYSVKESFNDGKFLQEITTDSGNKNFPTMGMESEEKVYECYSMDADLSTGNISANQCITTTFNLEDHGELMTCVDTSQEMTGNKQFFRIKEKVNVSVDGENFFSKQWDNVVPRKYV